MESIHPESTLNIPWNFVNAFYGKVLSLEIMLTTSKKSRAFTCRTILTLTLGHLALCHINVDGLCNDQTNPQELVKSATLLDTLFA